MAEGDKSGTNRAGEVYFYHMTRSPLEVTLQALLEKSLGVGWKVLVRGRERSRLEWLDQKLWLGEGFLPHGLAGDAHDADQPVLLSAQPGNPHGATALISVDGAEVTAAEIAALQRVSILFDGNDEAALTQARAQWKALSAAGCAATYWSQQSGQWQKQTRA